MGVGGLCSWVNKRVDTCNGGDTTALHAPEGISAWGGEEGKAQGHQLVGELHFDILLMVYLVVVDRRLLVEVAGVRLLMFKGADEVGYQAPTLTGRGCAGESGHSLDLREGGSERLCSREVLG